MWLRGRFVVAVLLFHGTSAMACSCKVWNLERSYEAASHIFIARLSSSISEVEAPEQKLRVAEFVVLEEIRGVSGEIQNLTATTGMCSVNLKPEAVLFVVTNKDGQLTYCSGTVLLDENWSESERVRSARIKEGSVPASLPPNKKVNATTGEFLAKTRPSRAVARYLNR